MAIKSRLFRVSSLLLMVVVGLVSIGVSEYNKKADMKHEETVSTSSSQSTSKLVDEKDTMNDYKEVVDNTNAEDITEIVETEEPKEEEPTLADKLGFTPIPGEEVPGISYMDYINYDNYKDIAIVNASQYINVRKGPGENYDIVGKIQPHGGCTVVESTKGKGNEQWAKIKSGKVEGYVKQEYICTGKEALAMVSSVGRLVVTVECDVLNVREQPSVDSKILCKISVGEELDIVSVNDEWIEVKIDVSDDSAFISRDYGKISYQLHKAYSIAKRTYTEKGSGNSGNGNSNSGDDGKTNKLPAKVELREKLVDFAEAHLGCKYRYKGTSFKTGIDCSAFTQAVYASCGISIPRTSKEQASKGKSISASQLRPGDLVFYRHSASRTHIAMYIGNNTIIHASNERDGVKYSNMYYTTPAKYVRFIDD